MISQKPIDIAIFLLVILNVFILGYLAFFKQDALDIEILKSGGKENFVLAKKLYNHPSYISQQHTSISEGLQTFGITK